MKIVSVKFEDSDDRYGDKAAVATLEDSSKKLVIVWFSDELTFKEEELIGLTVEEAQDLKEKRDIEYLRTP